VALYLNIELNNNIPVTVIIAIHVHNVRYMFLEKRFGGWEQGRDIFAQV
jgi:hypothetical protein